MDKHGGLRVPKSSADMKLSRMGIMKGVSRMVSWMGLMKGVSWMGLMKGVSRMVYNILQGKERKGGMIDWYLTTLPSQSEEGRCGCDVLTTLPS